MRICKCTILIIVQNTNKGVRLVEWHLVLKYYEVDHQYVKVTGDDTDFNFWNFARWKRSPWSWRKPSQR